MGTLQIIFLFLENHCKFEDENKEEDEPKASSGFNHTRPHSARVKSLCLVPASG